MEHQTGDVKSIPVCKVYYLLLIHLLLFFINLLAFFSPSIIHIPQFQLTIHIPVTTTHDPYLCTISIIFTISNCCNFNTESCYCPTMVQESHHLHSLFVDLLANLTGHILKSSHWWCYLVQLFILLVHDHL